jgi:hypothetical protein
MEFNMKNITYTRIEAGLEAPIKILHITDVHITKANDLDTAEHKALMLERAEVFREEGGYPEKMPEEYLYEAIELSKAENALLVCTGDAIDLHTHGNVEALLAAVNGIDLMFTPGGHEHQRNIVRTMEEPDRYIESVRPILEKELSKFDLDLESRIIGGLNIVTADNSLDYYSEKTLKAFKAELEKGYPIIVFSHDPIWDKLLNQTEPNHPNIILAPEDYRTSHEMIDLLLNHPLVITTVAGHGHAFEEREINGKVHYMTDGLFKGAARIIEII